jgi:hypothetical protein
MQQDAKGQIPAVDLRMIGGRGFIRGLSGIDDRGKTFKAAAAHLKQLAESKGEFSWAIELDLRFGPTTTLLRLLDLLDVLDEIARSHDLRGTIQVIWRVPISDVALTSTAKSTKKTIDERNQKAQENGERLGLDLRIEQNR